MIEVSAEFREALANGNRNWIENIIITLTDGTVLNLDNSNIWGGTMHIDDSVSAADEFGAVGACIINAFRCTINNMYDDFSNYNFLDAQVEVYVGLQIENEVERFRKGIFTVTEPSYDGVLITLECLDNMYLLDKDYSNSTLAYPATLSQIVNNICTVCGVEFGTTSFPQMDLAIPERPDDETLTCREVLSWCAMIAGCYARFDTSGILRFGWYDTATLSALRNIYDGGVFDDHSPKYASGSDADGGGFNPWDIGSVINMGAHADISNAHNIYAVFNHSISMFDVEITGVYTAITTTDDQGNIENHEFRSGGLGYVIQLTGNKFITLDNAQNIVNSLGNQLNGMVFRKAQAECLSDATIEAGDVAFFRDSRTRISYPIIISRTEFAVGATQMVYSDAENPAFHTASRYNETTKAFVELQQQIAAEAERRSDSIIDLAGQLAASSGLYTTEESTASGTIFYMHDKPTLAESRVIWKMNSEAWGVSTDGGLTWNAGMTVDGDTVVRILSATGINASWINAGTMSADRITSGLMSANRISGGILSLGGSDNTSGEIRVYDENGTQIGKWDKDGLSATKGTFSGALNGATGTFNGALQAATGTFSGALSAATGSFTGNIENVNGDYKTVISSGIIGLYAKTKLMGSITASWNSTKSGLGIHIPTTSDYFSLSVKMSASATGYTPKFRYNRTAETNIDADSLNAFCPLDMHNWTIKNVQWPDGGITGTCNFVRVRSVDSTGKITSWSSNSYLQFKNGILIAGAFG